MFLDPLVITVYYLSKFSLLFLIFFIFFLGLAIKFFHLYVTVAKLIDIDLACYVTRPLIAGCHSLVDFVIRLTRKDNLIRHEVTYLPSHAPSPREPIPSYHPTFVPSSSSSSQSSAPSSVPSRAITS